jgi:hypothetical protein
MGFTKLKDRIDLLPLVLAGPMVRRVEPASASVWMALRRRRRVRLEVYDASGAVVAQGERETVAVGANLHIACVTAKPAAPFPAAATCQYNLFFDHVGGSDSIPSGADLFSPRVVAASRADALAKLTYSAAGGPARPSFVLPPADLASVRLLHGSCRKESGPHADALEAADHILRDFFKAGGQRPQMLFLTGDNIYNDGCTRESFSAILDAAQVLLGWDETMPGPNTRLSKMSDRRWGYSLDDAGLSSPGAHLFQLFGLGETIALHLMAFAEILWPEDLDYQRHTFDFRGSLPAVRRALANLATYMIFDDHEFSNSWNLTAHWVELVLSKPMGRRVYQNSLAAYALCQGWGNTPDRFESGAGRALLDAIADWSARELAGASSPEQPLARIAKSVGLPEAASFRRVRDWSNFHNADTLRWDYTVPCPNLNIVVLDAYMWRSYESETANSFIVSEGGLSQQIDQAPFPETECSLIVVSNVAIGLHGTGGGELELAELDWGFFTKLVVFLHPAWLLAQLLRLLASLFVPEKLPTLLSIIRAYEYEPEYGSSYENQTRPFELLMARAAHRAPHVAGGKRQSRVVFVSGDAHRSCCLRMEYWSRVPFGVSADPVEGVMAQLLCSPCRWVYPTRFPLKDASTHHWAGWREEPTLSWTTEPDESPWRFKKSPWMMEYTPGSSQPRMNPEPEWRYSLTPVPPVAPPARTPLEIPDRPNPTVEDQWAEMEKVTPDLLWDVEQSHVLKANNLADVTFDWTSAKKAVVQQLWWRGRPTVDPNWTVSRFVVSMDPRAAPPPLPR